MKHLILYSHEWARRREPLIKELKEKCEKLNVPIVEYSHYILDKDTLKNIISYCPNGFDDIVKNTLVKDIQDMTTGQCLKWLFDDMDNRLTSIIYLYINGKEVSRIESGLPNITYMLDVIDWRNNNL